MPHSLRVRLKNLQRKGELTEKDIDRIFKALEQEPCEDTVGRKEIIEHYTTGEMANVHHIDKNHLLAFVEQLPPVRPQELTREEQTLLRKWRDNRGISMEEFSEALDALQEPQEGGANNG